MQSGTSAPANGAATSSRPVAGEKGISGTANYGGRLLTESNSALTHTLAFGTAGTQTWGEWERAARTNPFVHMGLEFVLAAIRDARLDFEADENNPDSVAQSEFLAWTLDNCTPGRAEFLNQSGRGALTFGFALHEMVGAPVEHEKLPGGRGYTVTKLAERLPASVREDGWKEDEHGNLSHIVQMGPKKMGREFPTVELPASDVLLHTWNRNGNNYAGFSAFRPVWYAVKQQEEILKAHGIGIVRESCGIPTVESTGLDSPDLTPDQRESLEDFCLNATYHENANIIMPRGYGLKWIFSGGANKGHVMEAYQALGRIVLACVGAQQIELGTGSTGSRSVGEVHQASSQAFIQGVCASLERVLEKLVKTVVDWNWPDTKPGAYPKPKLTLKKATLGPKERFEAMKLAKDAGLLTVTAADENIAREELGLSPLDEDERAAAKDEARANLPVVPAAPGANPLPPGAAPSRLSATSPVFMPRRPLRESEKVLDLSAISDFFDGSRETFANGVRPLVAMAVMKLLPAVKDAMADGVIDADEVADLPLDVATLDAFVASFLEKCRAEGYRQVRNELRKSAPEPLKFAAEEEQDDKGFPEPDGPSEAQQDAQDVLAATRKHLVRRMKNRVLSDMEGAAVDVLRTNGEAEEVVSRVMERQVTTGAFKQDAGLVITKAFSVGREEFAQEMGDSVESVELSAILDQSTCTECESLDGTEFDFNSEQHDALTPPLSSRCHGGDNCRCLLLYRFARERS